MNGSRKLFPLAVMVAALRIYSVEADAATLSRTTLSKRVCQVIGDKDWISGAPTAAKTFSNFGLDAVDLGFPVDSGRGPLYFLFGDAWPSGHLQQPLSTLPPDDALGWTTRSGSNAPDATTCLDLELATSAPHEFAHPTVHPAIQQGTFNVPTGGVFLDDKLYAFFWTDHCVDLRPLITDPFSPLSLPSAIEGCPQTSESNSIGRSVIAEATPHEVADFHRPVHPGHPAPLRQMPSGFVYVSAVEKLVDMPPGLTEANLPHGGIAVFGAPRYRASIPYLAIAPRETFSDPDTWFFMHGRDDGNISWFTRGQWEVGHDTRLQWVPPGGAEIFEGLPVGERCVGEHSVTWNAPLQVWLLLYNCGPGPRTIEARFAPEPWGPWSPPTVVLSAADPGVMCMLIMNDNGCAPLPRRSYFPTPGIFYAPFVLNRFTEDKTAGAGQPKRATIYWLLSTFNPYIVVVMQTTLELQQ
jgi:Domain of unknown function (DUF4185)